MRSRRACSDPGGGPPTTGQQPERAVRVSGSSLSTAWAAASSPRGRHGTTTRTLCSCRSPLHCSSSGRWQPSSLANAPPLSPGRTRRSWLAGTSLRSPLPATSVCSRHMRASPQHQESKQRSSPFVSCPPPFAWTSCLSAVGRPSSPTGRPDAPKRSFSQRIWLQFRQVRRSSSVVTSMRRQVMARSGHSAPAFGTRSQRQASAGGTQRPTICHSYAWTRSG